MTRGAIAEHRESASVFDAIETLGILPQRCARDGNAESGGESTAHRYPLIPMDQDFSDIDL
jgi:hypothetical protein